MDMNIAQAYGNCQYRVKTKSANQSNASISTLTHSALGKRRRISEMVSLGKTHAASAGFSV